MTIAARPASPAEGAISIRTGKPPTEERSVATACGSILVGQRVVAIVPGASGGAVGAIPLMIDGNDRTYRSRSTMIG